MTHYSNLHKSFTLLSNPIKKERVFFFFCFVLLSIPCLRWCRAQYYEQDWTFPIWLIRNLSVPLFYSYLATCFVYVSKRQIYRCIIYGTILMLLSVEFFLKMVFDKDLTPEIFLLLAETNTNEVSEFSSAYFSPFLFASIVFLLSLVLVVAIDRLLSKTECRVHNWLKCLICFGIAFGFFLSVKNMSLLMKCRKTHDVVWWIINNNINPKDVITNVIYCCYTLKLSGNEMKYAIEETEKAYEQTKVLSDSIPLNVILVIGESHIKCHSSVYGYDNKTNPYMEKEAETGNLTIFSDVISPYAMTSLSLKNMLNCNSVGDNEKWYDFPFFPAIFRKAGYRVFLWDMQKAASNPMDFTLNSYLYDSKICRLTYNNMNRQTFVYDGDLVDDFFNKSALKGKNLIIFHLIGQHVDAKERYPQNNKFSIFTKDSVNRKDSWMTQEMKQEIAEYDNATLYNDYVLHIITEKMRNTNSVMIYLSDHGEEIYDYRPSKGRRDGNDVLRWRYQHDIPFMIWCSDPFQSNYPSMVSLIQNSKDKSFMIDNLCHLMFRLGAIETSFYNQKRDLLDSSYVCPPRLISHDIIDYDNLN